MFRNRLVEEIKSVIRKSDIFLVEDFTLSVREANERDLITIDYKFHSNISFVARAENKKLKLSSYSPPEVEVEYYCWVRPGEISQQESYTVVGTATLLGLVRAWLDNVRTEITTPPLRN